MSKVRVLVSLDRNLQRLGFSKWILHRAQSLGTATGENLGHDLISRVTKGVRIRIGDELANYFVNRSLKKYRGAKAGSEVDVELQHLYLSDTILPSSTGNLVPRDSRRYPWLVVGLGLLREGTYSLTERGNSILQLCQEELAAFREYAQVPNPLKIRTGQQVLFLHSLLSRDGEAIAPLYIELLKEHRQGFSEADAARFLPSIYQAIVRKKSRLPLSIHDREVLANLQGTASSVQEWARTSNPSLGAWKHAVRFRLEAMVDLGWLSKREKHKYKYEFTKIAMSWIPKLSFEDARDVDEFLRQEFAPLVATTYYEDSAHMLDQTAIVEAAFRAWKRLRGAQGYLPIDELALFSVILLLDEKRRYFGFDQAKTSLLELQKKRPDLLRFTVDKRGALAHVKFLGEP